MGVKLWPLLHDKFRGNIPKLLNYVIDQHRAGWSVVGEECYCHPKRKRDAEKQGALIQSTDIKGNDWSDIEWFWVFDAERALLHVIDHRHDNAESTVELLGAEPTEADWLRMECGEDLSRCSHYAWVHFPELKGGAMGDLGTAKYLGTKPLEFHDAIAFIINGKRYTATGSGRNSSYHFPHNGTRYPAGLWIASVKADNGQRMEMPVAYMEGDYKPYKGVQWVCPPTQDNPNETIIG